MEQIWDIIAGNWLAIIGIILLALTTFFGVKWAQFRGLLKEMADLIMALYNALADSTITDDELAGIVKEYQDVITKFKELIGKA